MGNTKKLEDAIYQNIGLAANKQGIINQALATANVMKVLEKRMYSEEDMKNAILIEQMQEDILTILEGFEVGNYMSNDSNYNDLKTALCNLAITTINKI